VLFREFFTGGTHDKKFHGKNAGFEKSRLAQKARVIWRYIGIELLTAVLCM
jgi:hypothetical protein